LITASTCSREGEEDDGGISVQTERPAESLIIMAYSLRVDSSPREMAGRKRRGERREREKKEKGLPPRRGERDKEEEERGRRRDGGGKEKEEREREPRGRK
jgi:hypothetical protein